MKVASIEMTDVFSSELFICKVNLPLSWTSEVVLLADDMLLLRNISSKSTLVAFHSRSDCFVTGGLKIWEISNAMLKTRRVRHFILVVPLAMCFDHEGQH